MGPTLRGWAAYYLLPMCPQLIPMEPAKPSHLHFKTWFLSPHWKSSPDPTASTLILQYPYLHLLCFTCEPRAPSRPPPSAYPHQPLSSFVTLLPADFDLGTISHTSSTQHCSSTLQSCFFPQDLVSKCFLTFLCLGLFKTF